MRTTSIDVTKMPRGNVADWPVWWLATPAAWSSRSSARVWEGDFGGSGRGGGRTSRPSLSGLSWINRPTIKAGRRTYGSRSASRDSGNGYDRAANRPSRRRSIQLGSGLFLDSGYATSRSLSAVFLWLGQTIHWGILNTLRHMPYIMEITVDYCDVTSPKITK